MKTNPLVALGRAGQSPWIDYIHRGMIASGELARRIAEDGIRGVTSNPTIFEKAVSSGRDYDDQIRALARAGTTLLDAYKAIVTDDIRAAADVLRPVYDASRGDDGYVSLEVDPDLARDTKATIARARELFDAVGRPNVMIKIPGTKEGLPAVEETIAAGIPVNVTLIFSVRRYEEVADAYLRGVERWIAAGGDPRNVASVASFFVSRIDTAVDALLLSTVERWPGSPKAETALSLLGKTAVASARLAYARFLAIFDTPAVALPCGARRAGAAAPVGEHRDEEPEILRREVRRGTDRPRHREHDAAADDGRLPGPRCRGRHPVRRGRGREGGPRRLRADGNRDRGGLRPPGGGGGEELPRFVPETPCRGRGAAEHRLGRMILAGDVGGTKTSLALYRREARGLLRDRMATYRSREHAGLDPILRDFLGGGASVERACIGVAGPVEDGRCRLTNLDWEVDEASLRRTLGVREAYLVNDLQATASSLPFLQESDRAMIQKGEADPRGNMAVLSAGTGLGEGFLVGSGAGYIPLASEGGHVDFAPRDEREMRLHAFLRAKHGRVSVERVLSGPGLHDVYRFLREEEGMAEEPGIAAEVAGREPQRAIVRHGLAGGPGACAETVRIFCSLYGAEAGNLALQYLATGGVYLGGGIAPAILPALRRGEFLSAFLDKGRMRNLLSRVPVMVILDPAAPLLGAAAYAAAGGVLARPPGSRS